MIRNDVFKNLRLKYNHPENKASDFDEMTKIMKEKEKTELENRAKIFEQKIQYHEAMIDFMKNHYPTDNRSGKKFIFYSNNVHPMSSHDFQVQTFWKARYKHIQATVCQSQCTYDHHLFTFPFTATDNLLVLCSDKLSQLGKLHINGIHQDAIFTDNKYCDPIIMKTSSFSSLEPGVEIDKDVLNFCLQW